MAERAIGVLLANAAKGNAADHSTSGV